MPSLPNLSEPKPYGFETRTVVLALAFAGCLLALVVITFTDWIIAWLCEGQVCAYFCMVVSALLKSKCLLLLSSLLALLFTLAVMGMLVTWVSLLIIGRALDFPLPSLVIGIVVAIYAGFFLCEGALNGLLLNYSYLLFKSM